MKFFGQWHGSRKANIQNKRRYLQKMQPTRDYSLKFTTTSCGSILKIIIIIKKWAEDLNRGFSKKASCCSLAAKLCPTLPWPHGLYSPPGSSVHGILQATILERVAISSSRGSSWPRGQTHVSCIGRQVLYHWTTRKAQRRYTDGQKNPRKDAQHH